MTGAPALPAPHGVRAPRVARRAIAGALLAVFAVAVSLVTPASVRGPTPQAKADPALVRMAAEQPNVVLPLIVREVRPGSNEAERVVRSLGGTVNYELPIIGSFSARVPAGSLPGVMNSPAVWSVWADGRIQASSTNLSQYDTASPDTSWQSTISPSGSGSTGAETTVALIDTGITPSADLGNRVLAMVDFTADHDGIDRYGHGTHMAGIIAGDGTLSNGAWAGVAPRANLVSVKVAGADGSTDVSVVIAAMQWVVSHKANYNIRVLNLSFGTDSTQSYLVDPLDYAVEQVWSSGIFIAAAAGNRGPSSGTINKPADDVLVVTVGAADTQGTPRRNDDVVAPFSSRGPTQDGLRGVDLVAPAISIVSIRAAGSTIDQLHPAARVGVSYFKGTGTSQAAAMVSGAAANMISANPALTPDVVKAILLRTADPKILYNPGGWAAGAGMLDASAAVWQASRNSSWIPPANQGVLLSAGLGSLELSRGSYHVYADINGDGIPDLVTGEIDVLGNSWSGNSWSGNSWAGNSWSGALWAGNSWSGNSWSGDSWS